MAIGFPSRDGLPRTNADRIYDELRGAIMFLDPEPGAPLDLNGIASSLGVSRSPVRDALLRLARDGLVDVRPQRGSCVSLIDPDRAGEERFMRESLEVPAMALFAEEPDPDAFARARDTLAAALESQRLALERGDIDAFFVGDEAFHGAIFAGAGKTRCWEAVMAMSGHYRRLRFLALRDRARLTGLLEEHTAIFERLAARDGPGAVGLTRRHLARVDLDETSLHREYPAYFIGGDS